MNTYVIQILQMLLSNNGTVELSSAISQLKVTKRMFLYYQKQLNEYLSLSGLSLVELKDDVLRMQIHSQVNVVDTIMHTVQIDHYILNAIERQECILIKVGICEAPLLLEQLIEDFDVSRNTMISDITAIKKYLGKYNIKLSNKAKHGYYFEGDEGTIRYIIMKAFHHRSNVYIDKLKKRILLEQLQPYVQMKNEDIIDKVEEILVASEKVGNENFIFLALPDLSQTILLMYLRDKKQHMSLYIDIMMEKNRAMIAYIIKRFEDINIIISKGQVNYLYLILQAAKVSSLDRQEYDREVLALADAIILEFEAISQLHLFYQKELSDMYLLHIKSMYYRTKYKIKITEFQELGVEENQGFYYLTKKVMDKVSKEFDLLVDEDELCFLSFYFSCMEKQQSLEPEEVKEHIVVVCVSGFGSSVYVKYQLSKLFENFIAIKICDVRNLEGNINEYTKMIVTTVPLDGIDCKGKCVKKVNTVLTRQNKQELLEWYLNDSLHSKGSGVVQDVFEIIKSYTVIQDHEKLFQHLHQYFRQDAEMEKSLQLADLLSCHDVHIYDHADSWQQTITFAGDSLVVNGVIEKSYLDDILCVIDEYGLYCECLNGVLVAHAQPHENVTRPVLGLAVFREALYVKRWNKDIRAVFVLGVVDKESHANAFTQLITSLSKNELYKRLGEFTSAEELYREIIEGI